MKKFKVIFLVLVSVALLGGLGIFLIGQFKSTSAGLRIETSPAAAVFIDGEQVGRTPYQGTHNAGEVVIKLVPESINEPLAPFETKINLASGIETVIKREFGPSDEESSGEIISFEKLGGKETSLSVISVPDAAQVSIDGLVRGFTPYKTSSITAGEHRVIVATPGYFERSLSVKVVEGYKLTAVVKLAPSGNEEAKEETPEEPKQEEVRILETPTGFLRVRSEPSTLGEEVGRVEPGKTYPYLDEDKDTGWFKIEYEEGKEGWVSNRYAEKITEKETSESPSPSPTASPSATRE